MYAVWFTFDEKDEQYLTEKIQELSTEYASQEFTPHITAYGLVDIQLEKLDKIISEIIKNEKKFNVEKTKISYSEDFWKTVFVEFAENDSLQRINRKLTELLESFNKYEFKPHASLIYKKMEKKAKTKLVGSVTIKDDFIVSGMCIQEFSENISDWKITRKYQFE